MSQPEEAQIANLTATALPAPPSRRQQVEDCLREIRQQPDFPAFAHQISLVMQALSDEEASLRQLTSLILKDFSLTLKVLRTANSAHYNRSGKPILSITHAVALLGVEAIRHLAGSLLLFEHYRRHSPGLKQLMLLSLLTASQSREVAARVGYPRREEAYICGMFHNLGEVLIACYRPAQYAAILVLMKERRLTEAEAAFQVLGFRYQDLGQAAARQWNLPERVLDTMEAGRYAPPPAGGDLLALITAFSHALTTAVHRRDPEGARARLKRLVHEFSPVLGLRSEDVRDVVEAGVRDTMETFSILRVPLDELRLRRHTEAVLQGLKEAAQPAAEPGKLACGEDLLEDLAREIEWVLSSPSDWDLNNVILMILEAIYRSEAFDRVLFCLLDPESETVQGRIGLGEGSEALRARFRFSVAGGGNPLTDALLARRTLLLSAESGLSYYEAELLKQLGATCLAVFPIMVDGILVGCLYADRVGAGPDPSARVLELVSRLRYLAARAIGLKSPRRRTPAEAQSKRNTSLPTPSA